MSDTVLDFLTRQPVSGKLLSDRLSEGPLAPEEALRYAVELGSALGKIHTRGLMHGKVCPRALKSKASSIAPIRRWRMKSQK